MRPEELALLIALTRQLAVATQSERIKDACQVVVKAARARRARLARQPALPRMSPYYNPLVVHATTMGPDGVPYTFTGVSPLVQTTTGPHLMTTGHSPKDAA